MGPEVPENGLITYEMKYKYNLKGIRIQLKKSKQNYIKITTKKSEREREQNQTLTLNIRAISSISGIFTSAAVILIRDSLVGGGST